MGWDERDMAVLDLSVLPRSGMPKPPHLENWGDLIDHSSCASILPRSSSPRAVFWRPDMEPASVKSEKLQARITLDPGICGRLGFLPGTVVLTPTGKMAKIIGAVQTDPRDENTWRLWAEYADVHGTLDKTEEAALLDTEREQTQMPGTPQCFTSPRTPRGRDRAPSPRGSAGSSPREWTSNFGLAKGWASPPPSPRQTLSKLRPSEAREAHPPSAPPRASLSPRPPATPPAHDREARSCRRWQGATASGDRVTSDARDAADARGASGGDAGSQFDQQGRPPRHDHSLKATLFPSGKELPIAMAEERAACVPDQLRRGAGGDTVGEALASPGEDTAPQRPHLSASGFLMPARPMSTSRHEGYEVFTPKMRHDNTSTAYAHVVRAPKMMTFMDVDYGCFIGAGNFTTGTLLHTPLGTVVRVKAVYRLPHVFNPYEVAGKKTSVFSFLHHSQVAGYFAGDEQMKRVSVVTQVPEEPGFMGRASRERYPMERSLAFKDAWPRSPDSGEAFQYSEATETEITKWTLAQRRRRHGDSFVERFRGWEDAQWAAPRGLTRTEQYSHQMGRQAHRHPAASSSAAAIACRSGHGPRGSVLRAPTDAAATVSLAQQILSKRRPAGSAPVDLGTGTVKTAGWHRSLFDPAALPHQARYDHSKGR